MASNILPAGLDPASSVVADAAIIVQNGSSVERATPGQIADTARPYATQADAETGADNAKVMTPLRVKQALDSQAIGKANATAVGVSGSASNMGTTPGSILSDNGTAKQWFQESETAIEARPTSAALAASDGSALGFLQAGTGAVSRNARDKQRERVSVKDFGATGDGSTNDTAAIQAAITYIQTQGGGVVFFPCTSASYRVTGTLNIIGHGVTLEFESAFTKLVFANGSSDCIVLDGTTVGGAGIYNLAIRRGLIDHSGKTGGTTIKLFKANNVLLDRVQINNAYQPFDFNVVNNVCLSNCQVNTVANGQFALRFRAPGDGSARSDVLTLFNTVIQCGTTGADGVEWDGYAHTMRIFGGGIIGARDAFVVKNTANSANYYPSFLMAYDLEIDGTTRIAVDIRAGNQFNFATCDIFCLSSASGPVVKVSPDSSYSITHSVRFTGGRITGGQGKLLDFNAKNLNVTGATLAGGAAAGSGSAEAIAIGANAENVLIVGNNIGQYWGSFVYHSYAITVAAGSVRVYADDNNCYGCVTGEVLDNSGSATVALGGGINRSGVPTKSFLGFHEVRAAKIGTVDMRAVNTAAGASAAAAWTVATGTANAYRSGQLIDNSGSPYYIVNGGAAVTVSYDDMDTHIWRTNGGTEKARLTTARLAMNLPVQLKAYTVATLPASPSQGDLAIVTDSNTAVYNATVAGGGANVVKVCYLGGAWKVG